MYYDLNTTYSYFICMQVRLVNGTECLWVLQDHLSGIGSLVLELPADEVCVPELPSVKGTAVKALLNFNRLKYTFPSNNYKVLVSHIVTADAFGADHILQYVGEKLC